MVAYRFKSSLSGWDGSLRSNTPGGPDDKHLHHHGWVWLTESTVCSAREHSWNISIYIISTIWVTGTTISDGSSSTDSVSLEATFNDFSWSKWCKIVVKTVVYFGHNIHPYIWLISGIVLLVSESVILTKVGTSDWLTDSHWIWTTFCSPDPISQLFLPLCVKTHRSHRISGI